MRLFFLIISFYLALVAVGNVVVAAQDTPATPVSGWQIGPVPVGDSVQSVSHVDDCVMYSDYDNGLRVSLKAKKGRLSALRVEELQNLGRLDGVSGLTGLTVGRSTYRLHSRSENGRVDASLLTVVRLSEKLMAQSAFTVKLGGKKFVFSSQGFGDGYAKLRGCMGLGRSKTMKVVDTSRPDYVPAAQQLPVEPVIQTPIEPIEVIAQENVQAPKLDAQEENPTLTPEPVAELQAEAEEATMPELAPPLAQDTKKTGPVWTAKKGQLLSLVISDWAKREGVKAHIALAGQPRVPRDMTLNGSFQLAVNTLLKASGQGAGAPSAIMRNADGRITHLAGNYGPPKSVLPSTYAGRNYTQADLVNESRWRALEGADLRKTLLRWSAKNNIDLIWQVNKVFLVPHSFKMTSNYANAVSALLGQYQGSGEKPVAQLNTDPETGKTSLIISVSG